MTTKKAVNVDALLGNLFAQLSSGVKAENVELGNKKKKKSEAKVGAAGKVTHSIIPRRMKPTALILLTTKVTCKCGNVRHQDNAYPLCELVDKWGNKHITRFFGHDEVNDLPRRVDVTEVDTDCCSVCFEDADIEVCMDEDAYNDVQPVVVPTEGDLMDLVSGMLDAKKGEEK